MSAPSPALRENFPAHTQFVAVIEAVKALHVMVASVMADLAALRRTVLEDPELAELYAEHLRSATDTARPLLAEALECYQTMISTEGEPLNLDN